MQSAASTQAYGGQLAQGLGQMPAHQAQMLAYGQPNYALQQSPYATMPMPAMPPSTPRQQLAPSALDTEQTPAPFDARSLASMPPAPAPTVIAAQYSGVPVFEMSCRGISVMRRRSDSFFNATQLLKVRMFTVVSWPHTSKVAGVEKAQRTKIIERDIVNGVHEKVQGGFGKYQGTWIPIQRAKELAQQFGVDALVQPLFDISGTPGAPPLMPQMPPMPNFTMPSAATIPGMPPPMPMAYGQPGAMHFDYATMAQAFPPPSSVGSSSHGAPTPPPLGHRPLSASATPAKPTAAANGSDVFGKRLSSGHGLAPAFAQQPVQHTMTPAKGKRPASAMDEESPGQNEAKPSAAKRSVSQPQAAPAGAPHPQANGIVAPAAADGALPVRRANRPMTTTTTIAEDQTQIARHKAVLMNLFTPGNEKTTVQLPAGLELNVPLDGDLNAALHWACSLGRLPLVATLLQAGADPLRGNLQGQTPLIQASMTTNCFETDALSTLLDMLGLTCRIVDSAGRTVVHHIVGLGVCALDPDKPRHGLAAKHYLETVLAYLATKQPDQLTHVLEIRDRYGDSALNMAVRLGLPQMASILLDVGASPLSVNDDGTRPIDYGLNVVEPRLTVANAPPMSAPAPFTGSKSAPTLAAKRNDFAAQATKLFASIDADFATEVAAKRAQLEETRGKVRVLVPQVSQRRRIIADEYATAPEKQATARRIHAIERAAREEDSFDWTGRSEADGSPAAGEHTDPAFAHRGPGSVLGAVSPTELASVTEADPPITSNTPLPQVRRMRAWYGRVLSLLAERIGRLDAPSEAPASANANLELDYRRVVSRATGVSIESLDDAMLDRLLMAMESDGQSQPDIARVGQFMATHAPQQPALAAAPNKPALAGPAPIGL